MKSALLVFTAIIVSLVSVMPGRAIAPAGGETIKPLSRDPLPNVPGKELVAVEVLFPPGASSPRHTHPAFVYAYVLSGEIVSAVGKDEPRLYRTGESWHEAPGADHRVTRNPSKRAPARLLVVFVANAGADDLVRSERK